MWKHQFIQQVDATNNASFHLATLINRTKMKCEEFHLNFSSIRSVFRSAQKNLVKYNIFNFK